MHPYAASLVTTCVYLCHDFDTMFSRLSGQGAFDLLKLSHECSVLSSLQKRRVGPMDHVVMLLTLRGEYSTGFLRGTCKKSCKIT